MIDAYVDGRPMPSRSSSFTRLASEKRGGGSVKCCDGVISLHRNVLAHLEHGQRLLVLERLRVAFLARLAIEREEALELDDAAGGAEQIAATPDLRLLAAGMSKSTVVVSNTAGAICDAMKRCQMSW